MLRYRSFFRSAVAALLLVLDVWNTSTADGARVSQWSRTGSANQRFQLQRA